MTLSSAARIWHVEGDYEMKGRYLYLVVFVGGAAVLAIEILGTRILGPFYGVSLFLWSALITVTLVALSAGYAIGGRWADRVATPNRLYYLLLAAGLWTLLVPWLRDPILVVAEPFGLRFAVLVAAFILFAPPLTLLGMVSPYAIRVRASSLSVVGTTAGDLYAISTLGSVVAALLTGFVLIPSVGVVRLTLMTGGILLITAAAGLALRLGSRKRQLAALSVVPLAPLALWGLPSDGPDPGQGLLAVEQSPYAEIRVLDWNSSANTGWNQRFDPDTAAVPVLTDDLNPVDVWAEGTNFLARQDLHSYFSERGLSSY
jgi:MFS family permease